jgi:hypothetical protein
MEKYIGEFLDVLIGIGLIVLSINAIMLCGMISYIIWKIILETFL